MRSAQCKVAEFHVRAEQDAPKEPTKANLYVRDLRYRLISEELDEYCKAKTIEEIADAIGDLLYVVLGAACAHGIDIEPVFDEIHRSNMTKFVDGYLREDGKYVKGPSWEPPDIAGVLRRQKTFVNCYLVAEEDSEDEHKKRMIAHLKKHQP